MSFASPPPRQSRVVTTYGGRRRLSGHRDDHQHSSSVPRSRVLTASTLNQVDLDVATDQDPASPTSPHSPASPPAASAKGRREQQQHKARRPAADAAPPRSNPSSPTKRDLSEVTADGAAAKPPHAKQPPAKVRRVTAVASATAVEMPTATLSPRRLRRARTWDPTSSSPVPSSSGTPPASLPLLPPPGRTSRIAASGLASTPPQRQLPLIAPTVEAPSDTEYHDPGSPPAPTPPTPAAVAAAAAMELPATPPLARSELALAGAARPRRVARMKVAETVAAAAVPDTAAAVGLRRAQTADAALGGSGRAGLLPPTSPPLVSRPRSDLGPGGSADEFGFDLVDGSAVPQLRQQQHIQPPAPSPAVTSAGRTVTTTYSRVRSFLAPIAAEEGEEDGMEALPARGKKVDEGLSSDDEDERRDFKSLHELRVVGESTRFIDKMEYLFGGLGPSEPINVRRASYLDLAKAVMEPSFVERSRAFGFDGKLLAAVGAEEDPMDDLKALVLRANEEGAIKLSGEPSMLKLTVGSLARLLGCTPSSVGQDPVTLLKSLVDLSAESVLVCDALTSRPIGRPQGGRFGATVVLDSLCAAISVVDGDETRNDGASEGRAPPQDALDGLVLALACLGNIVRRGGRYRESFVALDASNGTAAVNVVSEAFSRMSAIDTDDRRVAAGYSAVLLGLAVEDDGTGDGATAAARRARDQLLAGPAAEPRLLQDMAALVDGFADARSATAAEVAEGDGPASQDSGASQDDLTRRLRDAAGTLRGMAKGA
ncbi:hypothetical protein HK405_010095 [Cladochytrium tenue]|nr:hypothetical protein HK405_010095 [Cladochytrium tenue]